MISSFMTNHLNNTEMTLIQLHNLFQTSEGGIKKSHAPSVASAPVMAIRQEGKKRKVIS